MGRKKTTGSYYTPDFLANFILKRIENYIKKFDKLSILEPSVGNGSFLNALININFTIHKNNISFKAIDINRKELNILKKIEIKNIYSEFIHKDFLRFSKDDNNLYDLIIGNPPYIKKANLSKNQIKFCRYIHNSVNLSEQTFKNIWSAFLIKSVRLLNEDGILAFILPSELLQVKYSEKIREFLKKEFKKIEIFTFSELLFECKGQNTIIFIGYKKSIDKGIFCAHISNISEMKNNSIVLEKKDIIQKLGIKWIHHTLSSDELLLLNNIKNSLKDINNYCNSKPGIVTAANNFFIINTEIERRYNLEKYTRPIIQKGSLINNAVVLEQVVYNELSSLGKPIKIICFSEDDLNFLNDKICEYLSIGETLNIPNRYKCKLRRHWSIIPNISVPPEGFFFKRSHYYPKLLKNNANVLVTDSAYKIEMLEKYNINSFIYSFYNSLTLSFAELEGRYYGGGVLELTPSEFKKLPLPYRNITGYDFDNFSKKFKLGDDMKNILVNNDFEILSKIGLQREHILKVQNIRDKLINKRLKKPIP
jgi:adenine-specific DNA-methyltransferase